MEPLKKLIGGHTSWNTKANKYIISRFLEKLGMKREFMEEIKRKMIERKRQKKKKNLSKPCWKEISPICQDNGCLHSIPIRGRHIISFQYRSGVNKAS